MENIIYNNSVVNLKLKDDIFRLYIPQSKIEMYILNNFRVDNSLKIENCIIEDKNSSETFLLRKRDGFKKETKCFYLFKRVGNIKLETTNELFLNFISFRYFRIEFEAARFPNFLQPSPLVWRERHIEDFLNEFTYTLIDINGKNIPVKFLNEHNIEYSKIDILTYLIENTNFIKPETYTKDILNWFGYDESVYSVSREEAREYMNNRYGEAYALEEKFNALRNENGFKRTMRNVKRWLVDTLS